MKISKLILGVAALSLMLACSSTSQTTKTPSSPKSQNGTTIKSNNSDSPSRYAVYETPPQAIEKVAPRYPKLYQRKGVEGTVWVNVEIFINGDVGEVLIDKSVDSSSGGLDDCAIEAVKQWKFKPALHSGDPVACWVVFPISFKL